MMFQGTKKLSKNGHILEEENPFGGPPGNINTIDVADNAFRKINEAQGRNSIISHTTDRQNTNDGF